MAAPQVTIEALTTAVRDGAGQGSGTFDVLIRSVKEHLNEEFRLGRVQGREFATLYLGSLQAVLTQAVDFVFRSQQMNLDAQLKEQQLQLGAVEIQKSQAELANLQAQKLLIEAQTAQVNAQTLLVGSQKLVADQQKINLADELLMSEKQRGKIDQEMANMVSQRSLIDQQTSQVIAQTALTTSQKAQIDRETDNLLYQRDVIQQTYRKMIQETELVVQQCNLVIQQVQNALKDRELVSVQILKVGSERDLIGKKIITEQAQYSGDGVSTDSVIGRQKALYAAQAAGFQQDAIQKACKMMIDTWNVRRTTDENTLPSGVNRLDDANVGAFVLALAQQSGVALP